MANDLKKPISEWANEGHKIVTDFVYHIQEKATPSDVYVFYAKGIIHKQLAKGGYRLALTLLDVFDVTPSRTPWPHVFLN